MSPSATLPRLPRKVLRRHGRLPAPKRATRPSPVPQAPHRPRKTKVDVAKCHACHVKRWWMSPDPAQCHKCHACHAERRSMVCDKVVCDNVVCLCVCAVCDNVVCDKVMWRRRWRRRRRRTGGGADGIQKQRQEPTQRCGGKNLPLGTLQQFGDETEHFCGICWNLSPVGTLDRKICIRMFWKHFVSIL